MPTNTGDLLLHPVRLRVVQALARRAMTAGDLQALLGDVAQATLYRQLTALEEGGLIEVVDRRQARGGTERTFAVVDGAVSLDQADVAHADADDHMRWFTVFVGTLLADWAAYLEGGGTDLAADRAGYRQVPLWLTDEETDGLVAALRDVVEPYLALPRTPDRRRRLLSTVLAVDERVVDDGRDRSGTP